MIRIVNAGVNTAVTRDAVVPGGLDSKQARGVFPRTARYVSADGEDAEDQPVAKGGAHDQAPVEGEQLSHVTLHRPSPSTVHASPVTLSDSASGPPPMGPLLVMRSHSMASSTCTVHADAASASGVNTPRSRSNSLSGERHEVEAPASKSGFQK